MSKGRSNPNGVLTRLLNLVNLQGKDAGGRDASCSYRSSLSISGWNSSLHYNATMLYYASCNRDHNVLMVSFKRQYPLRIYPGRSDKDPSKNH